MNSIDFNTLMDWKKQDVVPEERSKFLIELIKKENVSMREFARSIGVSHSTLSDWITLRQTKKYHTNKLNEIFSIADRLLFLLSQNKKIDEKALGKLKLLKSELDKRGEL